jgi:predicted amidohydrolase
MGKILENRKRLTELVTQAAELKAKIVVLPECAAHGYMQPALDRKWSRNADSDKDELSVEAVAETVPGTSTRHFAALAKSLGLYIALPLIEAADGKFYNTLVLLGPDGELVGHHRKQALWTPGDGQWAAAGDRPPQVIPTPYGRLGLMICYDVHLMPAKLKAAKAEIVLYSVGWYGLNTRAWFESIFPERHVVPNGFSVVAANWSGNPAEEGWEGRGASCVIAADGKVLAMAKGVEGCEIVVADLPIGTSETPVKVPAAE